MNHWLRLSLTLAPLAGLATCSAPVTEPADRFVGYYSSHVVVTITVGGDSMVVADTNGPIQIVRSARTDRDLVINEGQCLIPANAVAGSTPPAFLIGDNTSCQRTDPGSGGHLLLGFSGGRGTLTDDRTLRLETGGAVSFSGGGGGAGDGGMTMSGDAGGPPPGAATFTVVIDGTRQ